MCAGSHFRGSQEGYQFFPVVTQQRTNALFTPPVVNKRSYTLEHALDEDMIYKKPLAVSEAAAAGTGLTVGTAPADHVPADLGPAEPVPLPQVPTQDSQTNAVLCPLRCGESLPVDSDLKIYRGHISNYHNEINEGVDRNDKVACPVLGCGMNIQVYSFPRHFSIHFSGRQKRAYCILCASSFQFSHIIKHVKLKNHRARLEQRRDGGRGLPELNYSFPGLDSRDIPGRPYVRWLVG